MEKNPPPLSKPFNNQRIIDSTTPFPLIVLLFPLRPPVLCLPVYVSDFLTYLSTLPKAIHLFFFFISFAFTFTQLIGAGESIHVDRSFFRLTLF